MQSPIAQRWADAVMAIIRSDSDIRDLSDWARHVGHSVGSLRGWCAVLKVSPKASLDFGRVLRVVALANVEGKWAPHHHLDASDVRTLRRLFSRGAISRYLDETAPPTVGQYVQSQRFVTAEVCVHAMLSSLAGRARRLPDSARPVAAGARHSA